MFDNEKVKIKYNEHKERRQVRQVLQNVRTVYTSSEADDRAEVLRYADNFLHTQKRKGLKSFWHRFKQSLQEIGANNNPAMSY